MRGSPLFVLATIIVAFMITVIAAGATYWGVRRLVIESPIDLPPAPQLNATPRPSATPLATVVTTATTPNAQTGVVAPTAASNAANAEARPLLDARRFTILLLGVDQRPGEKGPFRTDTMMVLSLDPVRKTGAILSIPRDVYLPIPGFKADRINNANALGDQSNYPGGGGPALAAKTVEKLIGVRIDRYVLVNFQTFTAVINALGTVDVCPKDRIFDDAYPETEGYGVITVEFQPGCQALDATRLLQYARVRHNSGDDFGRAQRQQEVVKAVQQKVLSLGGVGALLTQAPALWASVRDNIRTNLTYEEILQLAQAAQGVTIKSAVLSLFRDGQGQLSPSTLATGEQVLSPSYDAISGLIVQLFDSGRAGPANASAQKEGAVVGVYNGAGIDGLAKQTADKLVEQGFVVSQVGNADAPGSYAKTEIRVYTGKLETARYLASVLGIDGVSIVEATEGPTGVDIALIVGKDLAPQ